MPEKLPGQGIMYGFYLKYWTPGGAQHVALMVVPCMAIRVNTLQIPDQGPFILEVQLQI